MTHAALHNSFCLLSYLILAFVSSALIFSGPKLKEERHGHMWFGYTSDKDEFPDTAIPDSKYLLLPANEPAKVQLHSMTSKKLLLTHIWRWTSVLEYPKEMGLKSIKNVTQFVFKQY